MSGGHPRARAQHSFPLPALRVRGFVDDCDDDDDVGGDGDVGDDDDTRHQLSDRIMCARLRLEQYASNYNIHFIPCLRVGVAAGGAGGMR